MSNEDRDPQLAPALDALRHAMSTVTTPRGVEKELMAAFAQQHKQQRWYHWQPSLRWRVAGGVGGVVSAMLIAMVVLRAPGGAGGSEQGDSLIGYDNGVAFIALESLERIEQEANPQMIETDMPRTALAALGVVLTPENAGDSVRAEMLVSADGEPLALRLTSHQ